jgi:alpha-amylase
LNQGGTVDTEKTGTFWYDGTTFYDTDPTVTVYSEPIITINPKDGKEIKTTGNISISIKDGNSPLTSVSAKVGSKSFSLSDFSGGSVSVKVADLNVSNGSTISISVTATNSIGSSSENATVTVNDAMKVDKFSWDNALVYFVMTDRFYNGNSANDESYGRKKVDSKGKNIGTFHGGDIVGLTQKLDYLDELGVNAIWISAPYEQIHGWVGGGSSGDFAHYAYHGYYVLDYTGIDKNMGTVEEFRTFVNKAHEKGIRVVMDIVMNHTGYENLKDMEEYGYGALSGGATHSWLPSGGETFHQKPIDGQGANWDKFWGSNWIRGNFKGYEVGGGDKDMCLTYLPDFKTGSTSSEPAPAILKTKWGKETSGFEDWIIPAAKDLRKDLGVAPAVYIEKWLAAWVEEFGVDGFRCDTAKHIEEYRWKELKDMCKTALENWRKSSRATGDAKNWDEDFWMTGECFPWYIGNTGFYGIGFDSMIDFSYNSGSGRTPDIGDWAGRANSLNGAPDDGQNALAYVSSHDTSLHRPGDMKTLGTNFLLLPGQVQIFYGDETGRPNGDGGSDATQGTRSDFNWDAVDGDVNKHWKKVGKFRQGHPAVGGGKQTEIAGNTFKRYYNGQAGEDTVVIYAGSSSSVTVSGAFTDGMQVRNAYTGETATVSGGKATFNTASNPVLVEAVE